jgi:hypothetical protein
MPLIPFPAMKKEQASFSLKAFAQRALVVTAIVALVEIPVVYFYASSKNTPKSSRSAAAKEEKAAEVKNDAPQSPVVANAPTSVTTMDTVKAAVTQPMKQPINAPITKDSSTIAVSKKRKDTTTKNVVVGKIDTEKALQQTVKQLLTDDRMELIAEALNTQRLSSNIAGKCVKIRKASNSNVTNPFAIADYLRKKGYIISGREEVAQSQQGFGVATNGYLVQECDASKAT